MEIPNKEEVYMVLVQVQGVNCHDSDNGMHINPQRRRFIIIPSDSSLTKMQVVRTNEVTVAAIIDENLNANVNIN